MCDTCFDKGKTESCLVKAPAMHASESVLVIGELLCTRVQANAERHTRNETREVCSCWGYKQHCELEQLHLHLQNWHALSHNENPSNILLPSLSLTQQLPPIHQLPHSAAAQIQLQCKQSSCPIIETGCSKNGIAQTCISGTLLRWNNAATLQLHRQRRRFRPSVVRVSKTKPQTFTD